MLERQRLSLGAGPEAEPDADEVVVNNADEVVVNND
jgi:hypothetical protein